METIYDFLQEWAVVLLMLCIVVIVLLAPGNLKNVPEEKDASDDGEAENAVDGEAEEDNDKEPEKEDDVEVLGEAVKDDIVGIVPLVNVGEVKNLPPRRFGKYTATSQTDAVLAAYPELLPDGFDEVEKLRKEFKTLGGKPAVEMTLPERTRYAVLAHILTVFR